MSRNLSSLPSAWHTRGICTGFITKRYLIALAAFGLVGLAFNGCSTSSSKKPTLSAPKYLYVGDGSNNDAGGFSVDATTGVLTGISGSPFSTAAVRPLELSTNGTNLVFAPSWSADTVQPLTVGANGALSGGTPVPVTSATYLGSAVTPDGKFLIVPDLGNVQIDVFSIAADGTLTAVSGSPFYGTGMNLNDGVAVTPNGSFVYVVNEGNQNINEFSINASGTLTEISGSPFVQPTATSSFTLAVTPDSKFLYSADYGNARINAYSINSTTGALTAVSGSPFLTSGGSNFGVTVDPTGTYVYASDASGVVGYTINPDGSLTAIPGSPFAADRTASPYLINADPSGKFVYMTDRATSRVWGYSIGSSGALTAISGSPWPTVSQPGGIAITH